MFGVESFGEYAFCEHVDTLPDTATFDAFLAEITSPRCWLLEIDAYTLVGGALVTLRYSTHGYRSQEADSPSLEFYDGRLQNPISVDRRITGKSGIGGIAEVYSEVSLDNSDHSWDELLETYAIDGRVARIYFGRFSDPLSSYGLLFTGMVARTVIGLERVELKLSDGRAKLDAAILNDTAYLGTGALEGGADLKGKPKPKGWGNCPNVPAVLVDSTKLIYQVNDGAISDVTMVYDRQILLTRGVDYASTTEMNANAPSANNFRVCKSDGYFRLGSTPAGQVTADLLGDATGGGYIDRVADIVQRILSQQVGLNNSEIDPASFVSLLSSQPSETGIWFGAGVVSAAQIIERLLGGIGAYGGFNRLGAFTVGLVGDPATVSFKDFDEVNIIRLTREPLPAPVEPMIWRAAVNYARNYTVQTDLAAAVTAARRTFAAEEFRTSKDEDAAVLTAHLLAKSYEVQEGVFADAAESLTEAGRMMDFWGDLTSPRRVFRMVTRPEALTCDIGKTIRVTHSRFGLSGGVLALVIGHAVKGSEMELLILC